MDERFEQADAELDAAEDALAEDDLQTAEAHYLQAQVLYAELGLEEMVADTTINLGDLAAFREEWNSARKLYAQALHTYRTVMSARGEVNALIKLGEVAIYGDDLQAADEYYTAALGVSQRLDDPQLEADVFYGLASLARFNDALEQAEEYYEQALALYTDEVSQASTYLALGQISAQIDDYKQAQAYYEAALARFRREHEAHGEANVLISLANLMREQNLFEAARHHFDSALVLSEELDDQRTSAAAWAGLSLLMVHTEPDQAPQLLEKALVLRDAMTDRYSRAADLGNFGAELLQVNRYAEAVPYFEEAHAILDQLELQALRERIAAKLSLARSMGEAS